MKMPKKQPSLEKPSRVKLDEWFDNAEMARFLPFLCSPSLPPCPQSHFYTNPAPPTRGGHRPEFWRPGQPGIKNFRPGPLNPRPENFFSESYILSDS